MAGDIDDDKSTVTWAERLVQLAKLQLESDPDERDNLADLPEHAERCQKMRAALFAGFDWNGVHAQLETDRARLPEFMSGQRPSTPYRMNAGN